MNITQTLMSASKSGKGGQVSDMEMRKWANTMAQKGKSGSRPINSFKDPSLSTGIFLLDLLEALRPGIVDPNLIIPVNETGDYEDRRQNGAFDAVRTQPQKLTDGYSQTCNLNCP